MNKITSVYAVIADEEDKLRLYKAVPARFTIVDGNPSKLMEELSTPCIARFYDQASFNAIADVLLETHVPIFVLGSPRTESDRHMNIYFTCDDSEQKAQSAFLTAIKLADDYNRGVDGIRIG
jgi:hypothetical protein